MANGEKIYKNAAAILEIDDLPRKDVWVAEWATWVCMQGLTGTERDAFEKDTQAPSGQTGINLDNLRAKLVARCAIDPETGNLLFRERQIAALGKKSATALQTLFVAARDLSGLTAADVEELEKNSASDQSDNSGSN